MVIAIDGPTAAGKTTVAKLLAARLGFSLLDTGAIYRCLALEAQRQGIDWRDESRLADAAASLLVEFRPLPDDQQRVLLGGEDVSAAIRHPDISRGASIVSALPAVRSALLGMQRELARGGDLVAEGRDIGTVVLPQAEHKFFLDATPEERARRRRAQLQRQGIFETAAAVLAALTERDTRDRARKVAPLVPAADAVRIDSTDLGIEQVLDAMLARLPIVSEARE